MYKEVPCVIAAGKVIPCRTTLKSNERSLKHQPSSINTIPMSETELRRVIALFFCIGDSWAVIAQQLCNKWSIAQVKAAFCASIRPSILHEVDVLGVYYDEPGWNLVANRFVYGVLTHEEIQSLHSQLPLAKQQLPVAKCFASTNQAWEFLICNGTKKGKPCTLFAIEPLEPVIGHDIPLFLDDLAELDLILRDQALSPATIVTLAQDEAGCDGNIAVSEVSEPVQPSAMRTCNSPRTTLLVCNESMPDSTLGQFEGSHRYVSTKRGVKMILSDVRFDASLKKACCGISKQLARGYVL